MTTEIKEGLITKPMNEAKRMMRPSDMSHKDFMFMQKSEWSDFHRIVLGRWGNTYFMTKEIEWWCNEMIKGRWFHSEANEVYYFEDLNSAIHFKLRWFSEIAKVAN
jgi:hypothetical protein